MMLVGIDTGVHTGLAVSDNAVLLRVESCTITQAMKYVASMSKKRCGVFVYIEDARLRKEPIYKAGAEVLQGVGSVKRDAKIWEDFCNENNIKYAMVHPKNNKTKLSAEDFNRLTGWLGKTNVHGRDAAMLVFGRK